MTDVRHSGLFYVTGEEVRLGDRVSLRYWFRRRFGTVCYIPRISPSHPDLGTDQWGIRLDDGTILVRGYDPNDPLGRPKRHLWLLGRGAASSLRPDEVEG
jgi:hypothetical protein